MNIEKQIEFDKIKEKWEAYAVTSCAKEKIRQWSFCLSESELRKHIKDTTDSRELIGKLGTPPLPDTMEIKEALSTACKGDCLTPYQLEKMATAIPLALDGGLR